MSNDLVSIWEKTGLDSFAFNILQASFGKSDKRYLNLLEELLGELELLHVYYEQLRQKITEYFDESLLTKLYAEADEQIFKKLSTLILDMGLRTLEGKYGVAQAKSTELLTKQLQEITSIQPCIKQLLIDQRARWDCIVGWLKSVINSTSGQQWRDSVSSIKMAQVIRLLATPVLSLDARNVIYNAKNGLCTSSIVLSSITTFDEAIVEMHHMEGRMIFRLQSDQLHYHDTEIKCKARAIFTILPNSLILGCEKILLKREREGNALSILDLKTQHECPINLGFDPAVVDASPTFGMLVVHPNRKSFQTYRLENKP